MPERILANDRVKSQLGVLYEALTKPEPHVLLMRCPAVRRA